MQRIVLLGRILAELCELLTEPALLPHIRPNRQGDEKQACGWGIQGERY
jgi:hypothetical protein